MLMLPSQSELSNTTVTELANQLYPATTFDTALPIHWVRACRARRFDPTGSIVWGYPQGFIFGQPLPLTLEAMLRLARFAADIQ